MYGIEDLRYWCSGGFGSATPFSCCNAKQRPGTFVCRADVLAPLHESVIHTWDTISNSSTCPACEQHVSWKESI